MPEIVLRSVNDGRELARAYVLNNDPTDLLALINRAISYGHELSYVETDGGGWEICGAWPSPTNGLTYHYFHPKQSKDYQQKSREATRRGLDELVEVSEDAGLYDDEFNEKPIGR